MFTYSVVVPVYNRPDEMGELLESLSRQTLKVFDLIVVEDGSAISSEEVVKHYSNTVELDYFYKKNTGPGDSRNFGMSKAKGDYIVFFDSDCVIPEDYFEKLDKSLSQNPLDAWGGPDDAHPSFSNTQKAINHVMTSFFTTGGIRGRKKSVGKFQPRSFNMGLKKEVYQEVGGFCEIHPGEDPDLSFRIMKAGYTTGLISEAKVYHKRRIDFGKFVKQVYKFGATRIILSKWHKGTFKPIYAIPSLFSLGVLGCMFLCVVVSSLFVVPVLLFGLLIFLECLILTKKIKVSVLAVPAAFLQMFGYGYGFLEALFHVIILNKNEKKSLPKLFFKEVNDYRETLK